MVAKKCWKRFQWDRIEASRRVCLTPCFLSHVSITPDAVGGATAKIYDGHGTAEGQVLDLGAVTSQQTEQHFDPPLFLQKGLYVEIGSNVVSVFVHYIALPEAE